MLCFHEFGAPVEVGPGVVEATCKLCSTKLAVHSDSYSGAFAIFERRERERADLLARVFKALGREDALARSVASVMWFYRLGLYVPEEAQRAIMFEVGCSADKAREMFLAIIEQGNGGRDDAFSPDSRG